MRLRLALSSLIVGAVLVGATGTANAGVTVRASETTQASTADGAEKTAARSNSKDSTVLFIKGYTPGDGCYGKWTAATRAFKRWGWTGKFIRVGFYKGDEAKGCQVNLAPNGTGNTSLKDLGRALAWNIYNEHSSKGESVDLVGHSMGGLIARAAVAGFRHDPTWPPALLVEDVVTLGTPHLGTRGGFLRCHYDLQCRQMYPGSDFLKWLNQYANPQAGLGTDWTLIGSHYDSVAHGETAAPWFEGGPHHVVRYMPDSRLGHSELRTTVAGRYPLAYRNWGDTRFTFDPRGAAPLRVAMNALYWSTKW